MDVTPGIRRVPPPDLDAVGEDEALVARIRDEIERDGPVTFARFMDLALYDPYGGYYRAAAARPGREGDFLTAPEAHPIFGATVSRAVADAWDRLGRPDPFVMFAFVMLITVVPYIPADGGLGVIYGQTIGFQLDRESPFSLWGQNSGLEPLLWVVKFAVVGLAVAVAFVPRRRDTLQVAALGAAVLIATQLLAVHWFYLYIVWFTPFLLVALFGEHSTAPGEKRPLEPVQVPLTAEREPELVGAR